MKTPAMMALLFATALLAACQVRFISEYDEATDLGVSALQGEVTAQLATLDQLASGPDGRPVTPACKFENFKDAYAQFAAQAHVLLVRNQIREKNQPTTDQLKLLEQNLAEGLPTVHREADGGCMSRGAVTVARETLDQTFRSILKLEIAKKQFRGG